MTAVGGDNYKQCILKISQLVDEIIKQIPALYSIDYPVWVNLQLCVVACHCWYNANLNKAVITRPT